jgi:RNA polymerase sigma factor (sigma-70 family)
VLGNLSDRQAVEGYLAGNRDAMALVESFLDASFTSWRHKFGSEERYIRSDVHFKLFQLLKEGKFEYRSSLKTYVSRIVSHTCIDHLRFNKKFVPEDIGDIELEGSNPSPEKLLEKKQVGRLLFRVMRRLPKGCIELWRLHLHEDLKYREIGERMGKTEGNIRRRLWECREKAKEIRNNLLNKTNLLG